MDSETSKIFLVTSYNKKSKYPDVEIIEIYVHAVDAQAAVDGALYALNREFSSDDFEIKDVRKMADNENYTSDHIHIYDDSYVNDIFGN